MLRRNMLTSISLFIAVYIKCKSLLTLCNKYPRFILSSLSYLSSVLLSRILSSKFFVTVFTFYYTSSICLQISLIAFYTLESRSLIWGDQPGWEILAMSSSGFILSYSIYFPLISSNYVFKVLLISARYSWIFYIHETISY